MSLTSSIGFWLVGGLWAPNADIPLIEAAVAQVKAGRPVEALRILNPIHESAARLGALSDDDRLLLFYTLGRAHEEDGGACLAWSAFDQARRARRLRTPERRRIDNAMARVDGQRGARLRVECAGRATVAGPVDVSARAEQCPFEVSGLDPTERVEVRFEASGLPFAPIAVRLTQCETARVVMPPTGQLTLTGATEARIGAQIYDLPTTIAVPPGAHTIEADGRQHRVRIAPGSARTLDLSGALAAVPGEASDGSAWPWVAVGAAGLATAITGGLALTKGAEHAALQDDVNAGRSSDRAGVLALEDETNQFAIAAAVFGVATAGCLVWAFWPNDDDATAFVTPGGVGWRF